MEPVCGRGSDGWREEEVEEMEKEERVVGDGIEEREEDGAGKEIEEEKEEEEDTKEAIDS